MSAAANKDEAAPGVAKRPMDVALIVGLANSLVALAALGTLAYTKILYKRPAITEQSERARLAQLKLKPEIAVTPGAMTFEPLTVNIQSTPRQARAADGTPNQIEGKLHFVTLSFTLEIRDESRKAELQDIRPLFLDKLLGLLGRKTFQELSTVQGRYILKTQILEAVNQLLAQRANKPETLAGNGLVTAVHFTHFVVQ
ncbi:MAG: flagellar basal body-associated FliL family protein [Oligoflexia bacterium]|nr:flagellar basal body-associated FliL family protein [Oligoflexia bacterium]